MQSNLTRKELHDYFAAEAMNGLVVGAPNRGSMDAKVLARRAFEIASAMLAESDRQLPQPEEVTDPTHFVAPGN